VIFVVIMESLRSCSTTFKLSACSEELIKKRIIVVT